eukprot:59161-Alexandrium_andersonii.AAC.1
MGRRAWLVCTGGRPTARLNSQPRPPRSRLEWSSAPPGKLGGKGGWPRPSADLPLPSGGRARPGEGAAGNSA